jgi:glycerol-3-phosphate acyltransferase PlsX
MNIGIDMMGGDFAPLEAFKGIAEYLNTESSEKINLCLIGKKEELDPLLNEHNLSKDRLSVVHAEQVIEMHDLSALAFNCWHREK